MASTGTILLLLNAILASGSEPLKCGVSTARFPECPKCLMNALDSGKMDFWWNWNTETKMDYHGFTESQKAEAERTFIPMLWGQTPPASGYGFLKSQGTDTAYVMGYNEPDQYGPSCNGEWDPPSFGCELGQFRHATSSGWLPIFNPKLAANFWQQTVNNMTSLNMGGVTKIISPGMAQGAEKTNECNLDPAVGNNPKYCPGWLAMFKEATLNLPCTSFSGKKTNCWDVIDVLQMHAYAHTADAVKTKLDGYYKVFAEDFEGMFGRTKKTLWLTEVAKGSNDADEIVEFIDELMNPRNGLTNRQAFPYLEKVSWFSDWSFDSFKLEGYTPRKYERWSSSLFSPFGAINKVGRAFFQYCAPA